MSRGLYARIGLALLAVISVSCSESPSAPSVAGATEGPGGSTLKVTAPTPLTLLTGDQIKTRQPTLSWRAAAAMFVPTDVSYQVAVSTPNGQVVYEQTVGGGSADGQTELSHTLPSQLDRDTPYRWRVRAVLGVDGGPWSGDLAGTTMFVTARENRTPDPGPGDVCFDSEGNSRSYCLPMPSHGFVVQEIAAQFPNALYNSCQEHGGSWEFMDRVVDRLRELDTRWGYNWKRGIVGDPSLDALTYHFSGGPDEGSRDVHAVDIITGHCGDNPGPTFSNITNFYGAGAMWTGRGRF